MPLDYNNQTQPVNILCGIPVCTSKNPRLLACVDQIFSHECLHSGTKIEPTLSDMKSTCSNDSPPPKPQGEKVESSKQERGFTKQFAGALKVAIKAFGIGSCQTEITHGILIFSKRMFYRKVIRRHPNIPAEIQMKLDQVNAGSLVPCWCQYPQKFQKKRKINSSSISV